MKMSRCTERFFQQVAAAMGDDMISVGFSQNTETAAAIREALDASGADQDTGWLLVLAGRRHQADAVLASISRMLGDIPVFGGSCVGAISNDRSGYSGHEIVIAAFGADSGEPEICLAEPLEDNERAAGEKIGRWLGEQGGGQAMLFYDVTREQGGINVGSFLLDGIYDALPDGMEPLLFGAGLLGDFPLTESYLFTGGRRQKNAALAIAVPRGLRARTRVMHGCAPVSGVMKVTRASGARIQELDGVPALQVLQRLAGSEELALAFSVLFGRRAGDMHAPFREADFINRLIIDINEEDGSVGLFEADIQTGDEVQVMMRDNHLLMDSVKSGVRLSLEELRGEQPVFAMYVDCAGRASVFTGSSEEEARKLTDLFQNTCPLLGFYAGREIAPFAGRSRPLDWTGVLVTFTEAASGD